MVYQGYEQLKIDVSDSVATLTLNRPEILNAMDEGMSAELDRAWVELDQDPEVKAIVLTGAGTKFCVGANFKAMQAGQFKNAFEKDIFSIAMKRVHDHMNIRVPVIAAVNGDAVGGGATLALMCDVVLMAESARIGDPHVRSGAAAGDGGLILWTMLVGPLRAKEYLMTGDLVSATEADRIGLISRVVPDASVLTEAMALAHRFAHDLPPHAVRWTKYSVNKLIRANLMSAFDVSLALELLTFETEDRKEAINSFVDKRKPKYQGR
jgi:enoyl-CoA hydratase